MNSLNGHLVLLFFKNKAFFFFVNGLNGLFNFILEVKVEGIDGELNISDFFKPKVDEVLIVCVADLFVVGLDLGLQKSDKILSKVFLLVVAHADFRVAEYNEIKDP